MGCDGGTIPRRDELVKVQKKPQVNDNADFQLAHRWRSCHLSQQVLQSPIVMCGHGYLYNKVALIEGLLNRETLPESTRHIKSLKDVKNLNLTPNPAYEDKESQSAPYICPVTGTEMMGKQRFVGLWSCGCVFSRRALKEVGSNVCHRCQMPFTEEDVIILNANNADITVMKCNTVMRQQRNKSGRKVKTQLMLQSETGTSTSNDSAAGKWVSVKRVGIGHSNAKIKHVKPSPSIANDPHASDVYKSLFTSHHSEQKQTRAHWITYNPFYN